MNDVISITINGKQIKLTDESKLWDVVDTNNPFDTDPSIIKLNGKVMGKDEDVILRNGDKINIYPVLIGG